MRKARKKEKLLNETATELQLSTSTQKSNLLIITEVIEE
jgi:hypothetical protein